MSCLSAEIALDLARGAISPAENRALRAHTESCAHCMDVLHRAEEEVRLARFALSPASPKAQSPCPEDESLALYLDDALPEPERQHLETHLASCRQCRETLADMDQALQNVLEPDAELDVHCTPTEGSATSGTERLSSFWKRAK